MDERLLRTQRNWIFRVLEDNAFEASCFEWVDIDRYNEHSRHNVVVTIASSIVYAPSPEFFYTFGKFIDQFSPGSNERIQNVNVVEFGLDKKWDFRIRSVHRWLQRLKAEVDAPDLWSQLLIDRDAYQLASSTVGPGDVFTAQDKRYLTQQFRQLQDQLSTTYQLQEQQIHAMEQQFGDIVESMNRFGKKDWLNWAIGALTGFALNAAFAPAVARDLFHGFIGAAGPLFEIARNLLL